MTIEYTLASVADFEEFLSKSFEAKKLVYLGMVRLAKDPTFKHYQKWLDSGHHANMLYMESHKEIREDSTRLFKGARTGIVFGYPYYLGDTYIQVTSEPASVIAQYARRSSDYHKTMKVAGTVVGKEILAYFKAREINSRICVDCVPVSERTLAASTLSGAIGKNGSYINSTYGSYLLLGEIVLDLDISPLKELTKSPSSKCVNCNRCMEVCPLGAIESPHLVNSRRCFSYWSIENRQVVPIEFWFMFKYYFFGCDLCQLCCPQNFSVKQFVNEEEKSWVYPSLYEIAIMDQKSYERYFGGTALTRAKIYGLRRNALISLAVAGDQRLSLAVDKISPKDHQVLQETAYQINQYQREMTRTKP